MEALENLVAPLASLKVGLTLGLELAHEPLKVGGVDRFAVEQLGVEEDEVGQSNLTVGCYRMDVEDVEAEGGPLAEGQVPWLQLGVDKPVLKGDHQGDTGDANINSAALVMKLEEVIVAHLLFHQHIIDTG